MGLAVLIALTVQIILTALDGKLGENNNRYANTVIFSPQAEQTIGYRNLTLKEFIHMFLLMAQV
jgi:hypothetical protein